MKNATISLFINGDRVILAKKKESFGAGKWYSYGGKIRFYELWLNAIKFSARREIWEESRIKVQKSALEQFALIKFYFAGRPAFKCHIFIIKDFDGEPKETKEMGEPKWFSFSKIPCEIPFDDMWPGDRLWMPLVFSGRKIKGRIDFNIDGSSVERFFWEEADFN